ncbi:MAG TPA: TonB-dependent receptor [Blastocatellia bacterium]|nr:TonB-dependent receptor [Blastocatellia bacterium]
MRRIQALAIVFLLAAPIFGQTNKGGITGTVTDQTGAVIAGASVTVTNIGTNEAIKLTTSDGGTFSAPLLDPVEYRVTVEAQGFKKSVVQKVKVDTANTATVNVTLEAGAASVEITVVAGAPLVNTESGTPGRTITQRQIVDVPLNNRSVLDLAVTAPNVSGDAGSEDPDLASTIPTPGFNLFVNGGRAGTTNILADGARNTGVGLGRAVVTFSPDSVQEFTVQTSNFSAEYGQSGGGIINMTTKSGSNRLEGTLYWYHRNPALNAAPFTTATTNRPVSNRRQHQFGAIVGGPVWIPKVYDGHDKTFFFVAYEPRYYYDSTPTDGLLPTDAMRRGDFSNVVFVNGGYTTADIAARFGLPALRDATIYNQFEVIGNQFRRLPAPAAGQTFPVFPGNRIPANMLDPTSQELLKYLATPGDYFINGAGQLRNYASTAFIVNRENRLTTRIDHQFNNNNRLSGRYTQVPIRGNRGTGDFQIGRDEVNTGGTDYSWSRQVLLSDTWTVSPTMINELRANYTYGRFSRTLPPMFDMMTGRNLSTELGLPSVTPGGLPQFDTNMGFIGWAQSQQNENAEHTYNIADNFTWVHQNMTWKFGTDLADMRLKTIPLFGGVGGRYDMTNRNWSNSALTNGAGGIEFAQFLMGIHTAVLLRDTLIPYYYDWKSAAFFVQNDWKVRPNLTLNLGLRYTLQLPRTEKYDRQGAFLPELAKEYPLAAPVTLPDGRVITKALVPPFAFSGRGGRDRYLFPVDYNGWEPRIGFAWVPNFDWNKSGHFVVRGGYGLSHAPLTGMGRNPSPDFGATQTFAPDTGAVNPAFIMRLCCNPPNVIPRTPEQRLNIPADGLDYLGSINYAGIANAVSSNSHVPYAQSWSLSLSYQLPHQTVVEGAYTGAKGTHLYLPPINLNPRSYDEAESYFRIGQSPETLVNDPLGRLAPNGSVFRIAQGTRGTKYLGFSALNSVFDSSSNSIRHAAYVDVRRRFSSGLSFTANYTFAKSIDDSSDNGGVRFVDFNIIRSNGQVTVGAPRSNDRSVSTFDVKHAFSTTFLYDLPFGRGRSFFAGVPGWAQHVIGDWSVSGVGRVQGGVPLVIVIRDGNQLAAGNLRAIRPDLVPGVPLKNPLWSKNCPTGTLCEPYFNPSAFIRPPKGEIGDAPRVIDAARWPTIKTLDLSIAKNFRLTERTRLQLRVDFINAFNHPIFQFGRDSDNGEIFASPSEALISNGEYDAWATFNGRPPRSTPAGAALLLQINNMIRGFNTNPVPGGAVVLPRDFFSVPVPQGFHTANLNSFDITTPQGLKIYRLKQAYAPDRWGFLSTTRGNNALISPYTPRFIQFALKLNF